MKINEPKPRPIQVGLISLGCAKNLVDAEVMLGSLLKAGFAITNQAESADVLIVNTCSFIDAAQEESVDAVLESSALREARNRGQGLIVSGCLPQRFRHELPKLLPEVDVFMGIDQVARVPEMVREAVAHRAAKLAGGAKSKVHSPPSEGQGRGTRGQRKILEALAGLNDGGGADMDRQDKRLDGPAGTGLDQTAGQAGSGSGLLPLAGGSPIVQVNPRPKYVPDYATPRFRLTPKHLAYVKIAEGCNHPCSFCTIPRMRGVHRSRPQSDVVEEARRLIAEGVKELNLISQDTTYYGLDWRPDRAGAIASPEKFSAAARALPRDATTLCTLLRALNRLEGDFWIRLLYTHPAHWTDELIETIADCPKVVRYVDLPLQHIHPIMLERMRRETSAEHIIDLIARIRARLPGIAIRTTFIVGFPGETEGCFATLLRFIAETRFERLGVFTYSQEEGTRAARMLNQVPERTKNRRRRLAMAEQRKVVGKMAQAQLGRELRVLVEKPAGAAELANARISSWEHGLLRGGGESATLPPGRYCVARGEADAPDIDGRVFVRGALPPGQFARVQVVGHTDYDLIARPIPSGDKKSAQPATVGRAGRPG